MIRSHSLTYTVHTGYEQGTQRVPAERETLVEGSLKPVYRSLLVRYEFVLGSFEIRFQFGMSSLNDHIRRISSTYTNVCQQMSNISIRYPYAGPIRYSVNAALIEPFPPLPVLFESRYKKTSRLASLNHTVELHMQVCSLKFLT